MKRMILKKGGELFIFRYQERCEEQLLNTFIEMAQGGQTSFDWYDAAVLSFKLEETLIRQADELLEKHL